MVAELKLREAVDAAFAVTGLGVKVWPNPHPDRMPLEAEYSRLLDPGKWRIVGARAEAWVETPQWGGETSRDRSLRAPISSSRTPVVRFR